MHHRSVAGFLTGMLLAGLAVAQPVQWRVEDGGNGHWYDTLVWPRLVTWTEARDAAAAVGGHLATMQNASENDFVFSIANARPVWTLGRIVGPWIGLYTQRDCRDCYEWVTGEPVTFSNWWYVDSPNCSCRTGVCYWEGTSRWQDMNANYSGAFGGDGVRSAIIEWSADCNNDGIVDKGQILSGELPDANNNGIPDGGPTITSQPIDQNVGVDVPVTFIVEVANDPACTAPMTYQWQRRNPLVADPAALGAWIDLADGSGFLNTRGSGLIIVRPTPGLATGYRCKMSGGCGGCEPGPGGFIYTNTVNFTIACPADFNADGGVDFGDVEEFFSRWENGC